jgi:hypothetical protein
MELLNGLEPKKEPDLCAKLSGLYTFMYTRLIKACIEKDTAIADEVLDLLRYERGTWSLRMPQMADENISGAAAASDIADRVSAAPPPTGGDRSDGARSDADRTGRDQPDASNLIGGRISLEG